MWPYSWHIFIVMTKHKNIIFLNRKKATLSMLFIVFWPVCEVWKRDLYFNSFQSVFIMWVCWGNGNLSFFHMLWGGEHWGGGGGYPITQYHKKNWQILKFIPCQNQRKTDMAFMIGHAYLIKLYSSCMCVYLKHVCTCNQPQPLWENVRTLLVMISTTIEKPCHWDALPISS